MGTGLLQLVSLLCSVFSLLILGRMKDEFADFDLEPKMRERRRRRSTIALFLLPPQLQYSKEVPKQLDDHIASATSTSQDHYFFMPMTTHQVVC